MRKRRTRERPTNIKLTLKTHYSLSLVGLHALTSQTKWKIDCIVHPNLVTVTANMTVEIVYK